MRLYVSWLLTDAPAATATRAATLLRPATSTSRTQSHACVDFSCWLTQRAHPRVRHLLDHRVQAVQQRLRLWYVGAVVCAQCVGVVGTVCTPLPVWYAADVEEAAQHSAF